MSEIYIVVSQYPYAFGEPFLEDAIKVYEHKFDKIYIVIPEPRGLDVYEPQFYVPANAQVIMLDVKFSAWSKITNSITSLFKNDFWDELVYIKDHYKLKVSWSIIKQILAYFAKSSEFIEQVLPYLNKSKGNVTLHTYWCTEYTYAAALIKRIRPDIKVTTRVHGWDIYVERNNFNYLPMRKAIFSGIDFIFTVSKNGKEYLINKMSEMNSNKVFTKYLGTTGEKFLATRKKDSVFHLLSLSFIAPVKRIDRIIDALALLEIKIKWTHIGGDGKFDSMRKYAQEKLGNRSNITFEFLGTLNKAQIFHQFHTNDFHAIINTSESEGLPVSFMEATSFGIPCIATAVGGVPEMVIDKYNGRLISASPSAPEIADAINFMATLDEDIYQEYRKNAFNHWNENFNAKKNYDELSNFILEPSQVHYKQCSRCVIDTIDYPQIIFDKNGICDICKVYDDLYKRTVVSGEAGVAKLKATIENIKTEGKNLQYDCLIGVSGGVDSTYLAYVAKEWGLRPLLLHVDNGWNSELAVNNIENIIDRTGFDLYTHVVNWEEIRDLQLAFIKASVVDLDIPTDNTYQASIYMIAKKFKIKYILTGHNTVTEGWLPPTFNYYKFDIINTRDIHRRFGKIPLKTLPLVGTLGSMYYTRVLKMKFESPLNWIEYDKNEIKKFIMDKLAWRDYGGKHYENIFTRFYQGYLLPEKYHVDKRKSHLSTLICSGQITKEQALEELKKNPYSNPELLKSDKLFFLKKMGLSESEFNLIMEAPIKKHTDYKALMNIYARLRPYNQFQKNIRKFFFN